MTVLALYKPLNFEKKRKKLPIPKVTYKPPAPYTLAELGPRMCHFPVGDGPFMFCGQPTDGGDYCPACRKVMYG